MGIQRYNMIQLVIVVQKLLGFNSCGDSRIAFAWSFRGLRSDSSHFHVQHVLFWKISLFQAYYSTILSQHWWEDHAKDDDFVWLFPEYTLIWQVPSHGLSKFLEEALKDVGVFDVALTNMIFDETELEINLKSFGLGSWSILASHVQMTFCVNDQTHDFDFIRGWLKVFLFFQGWVFDLWLPRVD